MLAVYPRQMRYDTQSVNVVTQHYSPDLHILAQLQAADMKKCSEYQAERFKGLSAVFKRKTLYDKLMQCAAVRGHKGSAHREALPTGRKSLS
jgi:hypothetical protein